MKTTTSNGYYSTDFLEKSKPGIYYLGLNGIRWLKEHQDYPVEEFRKRYRESSRSQDFVNQCVLIADCCIAMSKQNADSSGRSRTHYLYATQADYTDPESDYHFLSESDLIRPQLVLEKTVETKNEVIHTTQFIEIIEATMPRYRVRKRFKNYIEYLEDGYWQDETDEDEPNPFTMSLSAQL